MRNNYQLSKTPKAEVNDRKYFMFRFRAQDVPKKHLFFNNPSEKLPGSVLQKDGSPQKLYVYNIEDLQISPFKEKLLEKYKLRRDVLYQELCDRYDSTKSNLMVTKSSQITITEKKKPKANSTLTKARKETESIIKKFL